MKRMDRRVMIALGATLFVALGGGAALLLRANSSDVTPLSAQPKAATVVPAREATYRPTRRFVGTLAPWQEANVGPQLVSAYVETVLVRPGDVVKRGQVLATLDCRNASAGSQSVAMQARALDQRQRAIASEAARVQGLVDDGFVSKNEAEQKAAQSAAADAQLKALRAELAGKALEVNDCVLKAPFDGEITRRSLDPGTFVRPGTALVSMVDRAIIRVTADVPEVDFQAVTPGAEVKLRLLATGKEMTARVARRSPAADPVTRTLHVEIDVPDPERTLPVGTTAEVFTEVGAPQPAIEVPLRAATVRGAKATVVIVEGDVARKATARVLGETGKSLFLEPSILPGSLLVLEGRAQLRNGDVVRAKVEGAAAPVPSLVPVSTPAPSGGAVR
ncbi:efflux RND transporter periplasmic adaptor subunit [Polyangium jinanense]|uniref:Efflux RND transporter periplasmic adaptor subunit n=1 Tax=Polyangium jinanense TaxID=2829994 RepID=A0A9X4AUI9_9BACT|nr:efflux RND transporter periplasmic adaptor subunit [Polyangium jinanense]MDC3958363.1 efflux RND transporter periplasmic adaptor subunit [Polyangium jinanense]MDC3983302.1 efflux RND transporter periplasmic adaptor subunit [Polyangium jinanense]